MSAHVRIPRHEGAHIGSASWSGDTDADEHMQGQEVFISYGQQSNDRLLQYYGFVEPRNPADTYVMTSMPERLQVRSRNNKPGTFRPR